MKVAYDLLNQNGYLITFSPAMQFLYSDFDKKIGHFRRYSLDEMKEKMSRAGFEVVDAYYVDFIGVFAWYVQMKLLKSTNFNPKTIKIYDGVVNKFQRKFDISRFLPFGKNIFVVGKKLINE